MIEIGRYNDLEVIEETVSGLRVGDADGDVPLPAAQVPAGTQVGDRLTVFVYTDSDDQPVATLDKPHAVVGEFAFLEVVDTTPFGAFLDWGLPKDLLMPFGRQHRRVRNGDYVVVAVKLHQRTQRVIASSTLAGSFDDEVDHLRFGEEVELMVYGFTDIGVQVVVNGKHAGMIYRDHVYRDVRVGERLQGFILEVRPDHRLDITLRRPGRHGQLDAAETVLFELEHAGGFLALHDKSSPDEIRRVLGMSKKVFKRAIGGLYKTRKIALEDGGIRLLANE